jgi:hypothetical protein
VARFLSQEWVARYNEVLAGVEGPLPAPDAGLATAEGRFTVAQEVHDTPDGDIRLLVMAGGDGLRFRVEPLGGGPADDERRTEPVPDVTIVLSYEDAAAMSKGELTPAEALNAGRIRVRGDLSVLVAGQHMVEAARRQVEGLLPATTY